MAKEPDPREEWRELESELGAGAKLAPAYLLRGAERWYRERATQRIVELARAKEFELCRHDTKDPEFPLAALLDDLAGSALFASARLVVVHEPETLLRKVEGEDSAFVRAARGFLKGARGTLVLTAESLRSDLAFVKELTASGARLRSFRKFYERPAAWSRNADPRCGELVEWIVARAKERKVALTFDQAVLLAHAVGNDLAALDAQLSGAAAGGVQELLARLSSSAAGSPGEVTDGLVSGDVPRATRALATLFQGGMRKDKDGARETSSAALTAIVLGYLRPRVRQGLAAAQLVAAGADPQTAASEAGVAPFDQATRGAIAQRTLREWRRMLDDLLELERRSRRGVEIGAEDFTRLSLSWSRKAAARAR